MACALFFFLDTRFYYATDAIPKASRVVKKKVWKFTKLQLNRTVHVAVHTFFI